MALRRWPPGRTVHLYPEAQMRRFSLVSLLALMLCAPALAHPIRLGTLVSTGTTVNQSTTATPFSLYASGAGMQTTFQLNVQCDAAACINFGTGSSTASSCTAGNASKGVTLAASQLWPVCVVNNQVSGIYVAAISVSGTANCEVYWEPVPTVCF